MRIYGNNLTPRARDMRKRPTDAERKVWLKVRDRRFLDLVFRRQVPFGGYIADFVCDSAKLIVEIDGGQHMNEEAQAYDAARTRYLEALGYRVIRFWNSDVTENIDGVLEQMREVIEERR